MGHGRPMVGGYVSRVTFRAREYLRTTPVLRALRGEVELPVEQIAGDAAAISLRFLIVPRDHPVRAKLMGWGFTQRFVDQGLEVWEIPLP
jgi:hypothetical protein